MTSKFKNIIDVVQWILIVASIAACVYIYNGREKVDEQTIIKEQNDKYTRIYDSQRISHLEKENKALHDSIKKINDAESAIEIKYVIRHKIDTVFVSEENEKEETVEVTPDSVYHYTYDNDTIKYSLDIKAQKLLWHRADFEINDKFTIINAEDDGRVTTIIDHNPNVDIEDVTTWHRKTKFKDRIYIGPTVGIGYGFFNEKFDIYAGFSIGYRFGKK